MPNSALQKLEGGYLLNPAENISDAIAQEIFELVARGMLVIAQVTKRTYSKNKIATVQNWIDLDSKLPHAFLFVQSLIQTRQIYDYSYPAPPTGYLDGRNGDYYVVMTDGNHRTAVAISLEVPIGVRLVQQNSKQRVYPFSGILNPVKREVSRLDA